MDPTQQSAEQNGSVPPSAVDQATIPDHAKENYTKPEIPGKARLDEAVGKAVGGTVIASDIRPVDMPHTDMIEPKVEQGPTHQPSPKSQPQQEQTPPPSPKDGKPIDSDKYGSLEKEDLVQDIKKRTPGAFPAMPRIGWLDAYKRIDGPNNEFRDKSIWMDEFASSALFGAFWQNAAALFVVPVVCYLVFKLGGGFVSLILIIGFGATYYKNSIRRFRRNARDDITRELIKQALEDDVETTEWINNFLAKFWLIYEPVLSASIVQTVDGILVDSTPAFLDSIRLTTFTLGTKAPRVESIKSFPKTDPDIVLMDWHLSFTPTDIEDMTPRQLRTQINPKICLTVRLGKGIVGAGIPILVEDISFRGHVRLKLKLMSNFPHIKTLDFCFLQPPEIDYILKPVGGDTFGFDIAHVPGLQAFIREQIHATLRPMMYAPNVYTLDLEQMMTGGASLTAAAGVVQFTIYNGKDLKNTELVGNSDPYCSIRLGNRPPLATTMVKKDTLNPVWNETFIILVNNLNEVVSMELFDKDNVRKDRPLGQANFDLKPLEDEPIQDDVLCKVLRNGKERGSVRIRAAYFPVEMPQPSADGKEIVPVESNCGILALNLAQAKDIARSGKTNSNCVVYLNGKEIHSTKSMKGANPAWGAEVDAFITDLKTAQIAIEVVSDDRVIGTYTAPASKMIKDTAEKIDWVTLEGGEGTGKLKVNGVWKPILMDDDMDPTVYRPPIGVIRVQMFAARDLRNVEIGSESDPYILITGDKGMSRGKTKTIENDLNPEWNEIFYLTATSLKQVFQFECYDFQKVTKDRSLGLTEFTVKELVEELPDKRYAALPAIDKWAPLKQKDGNTKGEIHYELSFFPSLKLAEEATEAEKAAAAAPLDKDVKATVANEDTKLNSTETIEASDPSIAKEAVETASITLPPGTIYKSEVLDHDSGILVTHLTSGEIDETNTYCELYIDSDSPQFTSQPHKSRNPKWSETADIFVKELEYAKLVVMVKERTSSDSDKDQVIGTFTDNVRNLLESTPIDGAKFSIRDKHNNICGSLQLKFGYIPVPIELMPKERLDNMGTMDVTLVRAKSLIAADRSGVSDPYVVFRLNGKEVHKSEVIKKTLNPEFNERFTVPIGSRADDQFTFEVFDWNQLKTAKSLGTGSVDLHNIQLVLPNQFLIPLQNKANQGEVQLRVKFMPEFLSSSKKSGFATTIVSGGVSVGLAGVGAVANVGHGALDATENVGKGAIKGVAAVGKGVGAVGKGVFGGLSAGASVLGLHHKDKSGKSDKSESRAAIDPHVTDLPATMMPTSSQAPIPVSVQAPTQAPIPVSVQAPTQAPVEAVTEQADNNIRTSNSDNSLHVGSLRAPRTSVGSNQSRTSMAFDNGEIVGEPGNLTIQLIEADGLLGVDKSGTSDPYVKVSINSKSIYKTKVKKENLSPNWNESVTTSVSGHPVTINFQVKDHNTIGSDKDLGEFDLRLWEYIQPSSEAHPGEYKADFWAPLTGSSGRVHLALQFEPSREGSDSGKQKRSLFSRK